MFRFRQFSVANQRSGLKVGTDGVLLGALAGAGTRVKISTMGMEQVPATEQISAKEQVSATEQISAREQAPAKEQVPATEQISAREQAPAKEQVPATEQISAREQAPAKEQAPATEQISAREQAPAKEQVPATEQISAREQAPAKEQVPATEQISAREQAPAKEQVPATEQISAREQAPAREQVPATEQIPATEPRRILDIGTGTGLVALMLAQRYAQARITGIDIDPDAAQEASENFAASPWGDRLDAICCPLQEFVPGDNVTWGFLWDMIVSNPPFFENSLKAPDAQRSTARHTDTLSYRDIVLFAKGNMARNGSLTMILPSSEETALQRYAASFGLYVQCITYIRTTSAKAPKRIVVQLGFEKTVPLKEELVMMDGGQYTPAFKELTAEFYYKQI